MGMQNIVYHITKIYDAVMCNVRYKHIYRVRQFVLDDYAYPLFVHFMIKENCVQPLLLSQFAPIILFGCPAILSRRQP